MKQILKNILRAYTTHVPFRGRHQLSNYLGRWLSKEIEIVNYNGFCLRIDHRKRTCRHIYYGVYEEPLINFLKRNIRTGDIVFDPGANIGFISSVCMGLVGTGHVHAFEPSRICFSQMQEDNDWSRLPNLTMNHAALSASTGVGVFYDTPRAIDAGFACLGEVEVPIDGIAYEIAVFSVDQYCAEHRIEHIRFLKLDVEGAELLVLQGARKMLRQGAIDYILIETEINPGDVQMTEKNTEIQKLLETNGYCCMRISRSGKLSRVTLNNDAYLRTDFMWMRVVGA